MDRTLSFLSGYFGPFYPGSKFPGGEGPRPPFSVSGAGFCIRRAESQGLTD